MIKEMEKVDGVKEVLGLETLIGTSLPQSMIPEDKGNSGKRPL